MKNKQKSLLAKGLSLSVLTLLSRILGLVREMTKAHFLVPAHSLMLSELLS